MHHKPIITKAVPPSSWCSGAPRSSSTDLILLKKTPLQEEEAVQGQFDDAAEPCPSLFDNDNHRHHQQQEPERASPPPRNDTITEGQSEDNATTDPSSSLPLLPKNPSINTSATATATATADNNHQQQASSSSSLLTLKPRPKNTSYARKRRLLAEVVVGGKPSSLRPQQVDTIGIGPQRRQYIPIAPRPPPSKSNNNLLPLSSKSSTSATSSTSTSKTTTSSTTTKFLVLPPGCSKNCMMMEKKKEKKKTSLPPPPVPVSMRSQQQLPYPRLKKRSHNNEAPTMSVKKKKKVKLTTIAPDVDDSITYIPVTSLPDLRAMKHPHPFLLPYSKKQLQLLPETPTNTTETIFHSTITNYDVLMGRGPAIKKNPGNIRYRILINNYRLIYQQTCQKFEKLQLATNLCNCIRLLGGRFLETDGECCDNEVWWYEVGDQKAIAKISQSLREKATTTTTASAIRGSITRSPVTDDDTTSAVSVVVAVAADVVKSYVEK